MVLALESNVLWQLVIVSLLFLRITVRELCKVVVILTFTVRQPSSVFTLRESSELMKKQTRQSIDSAKEILLDKKQSKEERDG